MVIELPDGFIKELHSSKTLSGEPYIMLKKDIQERFLADVREKIYCMHVSRDKIAKKIGATKKGFRRKLYGKEDFTIYEILILMNVLGFSDIDYITGHIIQNNRNNRTLENNPK